MEEVYSEVASRVNAMGYSSSLSPSLKSLSDQQLNDLFGFLFHKYDSDLWSGKDKSNANIARIMGRLGLGHMVKDGKMVSVQNKKIALALNAVIEKLVLKHGEDEVFSRGGANKRQQKPSKPVENKENFDPVTPAHNKIPQSDYQFNDLASQNDVFSRKAKVARTPNTKSDDPIPAAQPSQNNFGTASLQVEDDVAIFSKRAKVMRTPVQAHKAPEFGQPASNAGGNLPVVEREAAFSRQSKLARTPVHPSAHAHAAPVQTTQADVINSEPVMDAYKTPVAPHREERPRMKRTPVGQPAPAQQAPAPSTLSVPNEESVIQPPRAVDASERQNVFQKRAKLARTPPHAANLPSANLQQPRTDVHQEEVQPTINKADVFKSKSSLMRSPVEAPAAVAPTTTSSNLDMNPKPRNQKSQQNQGDYTQVFGAKSKLARTPNNQPPPPPPVASNDDEDDITISKFDHVKAQLEKEKEMEMEIERERKERERHEKERKERERLEKERKERERKEREMEMELELERERKQREKQEKERKNKEEHDRKEKERKEKVEREMKEWEEKEKQKQSEREGKKREERKSEVFGSKARVLRSPIPVPNFSQSTTSNQSTNPTTPSKRTTTPKKTPNRKNPTPIVKWNPSTLLTNSPGPNQLTKRTPNRQPAASGSGASSGFPESPARTHASSALSYASPARTRVSSAHESAHLFASPARTQRQSVIPTTPPPTGIPFHDMSNIPQVKPTPLRTPISEKTGSLITPMKNGVLMDRFEKRTPVRTPNYSPLYKKNRADSRTPSKIIDPTILNPGLLRPEPFDFSEEAEGIVPVLQEIEPLRFDTNAFVEKPIKPSSIPNVPLGVAEEAYLREREETQRIEAMKAEVEKLDREIKKASEKKDLTEYQIHKFNDDITKVSTENEAIATKLQRMGMSNFTTMSPSSLHSELNQLKNQHQKQQAQLKAVRTTNSDGNHNLQHVEQQIDDISAQIQACVEQRKSLYSQMDYQKYYVEKTIRDLDEQIHQKIIERENEMRETENARREVERLSLHSRPSFTSTSPFSPSLSPIPPSFSSSSDNNNDLPEDEVKLRVEMLVARGKMLGIASQALRRAKMARRGRK